MGIKRRNNEIGRALFGDLTKETILPISAVLNQGFSLIPSFASIAIPLVGLTLGSVGWNVLQLAGDKVEIINDRVQNIKLQQNQKGSVARVLSPCLSVLNFCYQ